MTNAFKGNALLLFKVYMLEDKILSYDCALCPRSFLDSDRIQYHIDTKHTKPLHSLDDCPDLRRHDPDHFIMVKKEVSI